MHEVTLFKDKKYGEGLCPDTWFTEEVTPLPKPTPSAPTSSRLCRSTPVPIGKSWIRHWRSCFLSGLLGITTAARASRRLLRSVIRQQLFGTVEFKLQCLLPALAIHAHLYQHSKISSGVTNTLNNKRCVSNRGRNDASPHLFFIAAPSASSIRNFTKKIKVFLRSCNTF